MPRAKLRLGASLIVVPTLMLLFAPAGCLFGSDECELGEGDCEEDGTRLVCIGGEGSYHLAAQPCPDGKRCEAQDVGDARVASCVGASAGGACVEHDGCLEPLLCVDGVCGDLPQATREACEGALTIEVPTAETAPEGATLDTTFEPGPPAMSALLKNPDGGECPNFVNGSERLIRVTFPASLTADATLALSFEGLDPAAVSKVSMFGLADCDPRSVASKCGLSSNTMTLQLPVRAADLAPVTLVLQANAQVTQSVPVTVRAKLTPAL